MDMEDKRKPGVDAQSRKEVKWVTFAAKERHLPPNNDCLPLALHPPTSMPVSVLQL
jgi:hypothetical protein